MLIVLVYVSVKPDRVDDFVQATLANAKASVEEPGIARFDVIRDQSDANKFVLVEVYRDTNAPGAHKETAHYKRWRDTVEDMMAEPRKSAKFDNVFPEDARW